MVNSSRSVVLVESELFQRRVEKARAELAELDPGYEPQRFDAEMRAAKWAIQRTPLAHEVVPGTALRAVRGVHSQVIPHRPRLVVLFEVGEPATSGDVCCILHALMLVAKAPPPTP